MEIWFLSITFLGIRFPSPSPCTTTIITFLSSSWISPEKARPWLSFSPLIFSLFKSKLHPNFTFDLTLLLIPLPPSITRPSKNRKKSGGYNRVAISKSRNSPKFWEDRTNKAKRICRHISRAFNIYSRFQESVSAYGGLSMHWSSRISNSISAIAYTKVARI